MTHTDVDSKIAEVQKLVAKIEKMNKRIHKDPSIKEINDAWSVSRELERQAKKLTDMLDELEVVYFPV